MSMNMVTALPVAAYVSAASLGTESLQRASERQPTIPAPTAGERGASGRGVAQDKGQETDARNQQAKQRERKEVEFSQEALLRLEQEQRDIEGELLLAEQRPSRDELDTDTREPSRPEPAESPVLDSSGLRDAVISRRYRETVTEQQGSFATVA